MALCGGFASVDERSCSIAAFMRARARAFVFLSVFVLGVFTTGEARSVNASTVYTTTPSASLSVLSAVNVNYTIAVEEIVPQKHFHVAFNVNGSAMIVGSFAQKGEFTIVFKAAQPKYKWVKLHRTTECSAISGASTRTSFMCECWHC